jgi:hypothetical protein
VLYCLFAASYTRIIPGFTQANRELKFSRNSQTPENAHPIFSLCSHPVFLENIFLIQYKELTAQATTGRQPYVVIAKLFNKQ